MLADINCSNCAAQETRRFVHASRIIWSVHKTNKTQGPQGFPLHNCTDMIMGRLTSYDNRVCQFPEFWRCHLQGVPHTQPHTLAIHELGFYFLEWHWIRCKIWSGFYDSTRKLNNCRYWRPFVTTHACLSDYSKAAFDVSVVKEHIRRLCMRPAFTNKPQITSRQNHVQHL